MSRLRDDLRADFSRNFGLVSRTTILVIRLNQAAHRGRGQWAKKPVARVLDLVWVQMLMGSEIPGEVQIGSGLRLAHGGRRVIINPRVVIGSNVTIYHGVTLGVSGRDKANVPTIADDVYIGTNAVLIGRLQVHHGAKIGAGAVVTKDVPEYSTAVGVPATVRPSTPSEPRGADAGRP